MSDTAAVARLNTVSKRLGGKLVLDRLSVTIQAGEVTALLGPNGAGKSTTVGLVTGRISPDSGGVELFGGDPRRALTRMRMGVMLQSAGLPDALTVAELIKLQSGYYAAPLPLHETLAIAGLSELSNLRCGTLSGGQARRVQYALAICGRPALLVLDEPTVAMDREARHSVWNTVRAAADQGAAVLLTSHDLAEADALADRVLVMDSGVILEDNTPSALRAVLGGSTIRFRCEVPLALLSALPGVRRAEMIGADVTLSSSDAVLTLRALLSAAPNLTELRVSESSLEDAISSLLQQDRKAAA